MNHFFIVGAQRSGTSYLCEMLDQHPDVCIAKPMYQPELKFFINKSCDIDQFYQTFDKKSSTLGEKATTYFERADIGVHLAKLFPDAKIIICLRNPVERAISNFFFTKQNGFETRSLHEAFIDKKPIEIPNGISVNPFDYILRSIYHPKLKTYQSLFCDVKVVITEEMIGNTEQIKSIYEFLEVEPTFIPKNVHRNYNRSPWAESIPPEIYKVINNEVSHTISETSNCIQRDVSKIWTTNY